MDMAFFWNLVTLTSSSEGHGFFNLSFNCGSEHQT